MLKLIYSTEDKRNIVNNPSNSDLEVILAFNDDLVFAEGGHLECGGSCSCS